MSFLAPMWLVAAGLVAAGVVVAHLFSTSVPQREVLPTVRFIPEGAPLAVMRTRRITDWLLLLLRLAAVALLGLALAGAHVPRKAPRIVVLADRSRAVASAAELRDTVRKYARDGAVIIAFDSIAKVIPADSIDSLTPLDARGSVSAAFVAAHRAIVDATAGRTDVFLLLVSPMVEEEIDSATVRIMSLWEGSIQEVPIRAATAHAAPLVEVRSLGDDPVRAVIPRSAGARNLQSGVRVVRTRATAADSAWARDSAGALVLWPADGAGLGLRGTVDTSGAVATAKHVVVSPFVRTHEPRGGRVVARWADGAPAATEQAIGRGCVREVAIPVDAIGDMALRESFRGVAGVLTEPCGGARDFARAQLNTREVHEPRTSRQPQQPFAAAGRVPLMLGLLALAALLAEQALRSRRRPA